MLWTGVSCTVDYASKRKSQSKKSVLAIVALVVHPVSLVVRILKQPSHELAGFATTQTDLRQSLCQEWHQFAARWHHLTVIPNVENILHYCSTLSHV